MNKFIRITILMVTMFYSILFVNASKFEKQENKISPKPSKITNDSERRKLPATIIEWDENLTKNNEGKYFYTVESPTNFTYFGIGVKTNNPSTVLLDMQITYRIKLADNKWTTWQNAEFETSNKETPTNYFWSQPIFTPDGLAYSEVEFYISVPQNTQITCTRLDLVNIKKKIERKEEKKFENDHLKSGDCPVFPTIIPRSEWLDPYLAQPAYTSTITHPTHAVIHHGASPNAYTDGAAVVRSYWDYHVNSNGWSDIGYNYLVDKYGNIYQGRQNADMINQDVNGAHAGSSNPYSIGVNFLGNADIVTPTAEQLASLHNFLGWWFNSRGFDPTTSEIIVLQSGGSATLSRICGHKDVNIGGTTCPSTTLYGYLPSIITNTKAIIDACNNLPPTNLQATVSTTGENVVFSWINSGIGWYIAVSQTPDFANFHWKFVSTLTSYTGPAGFVDHVDGTTPLILVENTTYYWRIWDGENNTNGPNFIITTSSKINSLTLNDLNIYPNPFSENLKIDLKTKFEEGGTLKIVDILGNVIAIKTITKHDNYVEINNLQNIPKGFYYLIISSEDKLSASKLVKK